MRTLIARFALLLATGACSPGDKGALEPIAEPSVALVSTHGLPNDTVRVVGGGVQADVTGRWSSSGESLEIVYSASAPVTIKISSRSTWKDAAAPASNAWDITEKEPGNAVGRPLLGTDGLRLAAGGQRTMQIMFARPKDHPRPGYGDEVTITVPMPDASRPVRFRLGGE